MRRHVEVSHPAVLRRLQHLSRMLVAHEDKDRSWQTYILQREHPLEHHLAM